jgi:hypothetical protein
MQKTCWRILLSIVFIFIFWNRHKSLEKNFSYSHFVYILSCNTQGCFPSLREFVSGKERDKCQTKKMLPLFFNQMGRRGRQQVWIDLWFPLRSKRDHQIHLQLICRNFNDSMYNIHVETHKSISLFSKLFLFDVFYCRT